MAEEKKGFFRRLADGLTKTRNNIVSGMDAIFSGFSDIDDDFYERSKRSWSWATSGSTPLRRLSRT